MPYASKKEALEAKREGYAVELEWHQFLLDSFTGGGGYQGRVKQDAAGFWGIVSQTYSRFATFVKSATDAVQSYLDRFNAEDTVKYGRRIDVAHYLNYVEPTTTIKVGYIARKPHKRNNMPAALLEWIERTGYDKDFRRRALLTAVLGWFPLLVDMPTSAPEALTVEQTGKLDPYVVLNLPCHLFDYELDEQGTFVWAKLGVTFSRKPAWDQEAVQVTRYTIWTKTDWTVYEVADQVVGEPQTGPHAFGAVPLVSWRAETSVEDAVKAKSINANIALEGRRLFNLVSEMDEHIRCQVFAQLVWPGAAPAANNTGTGGVSTGLVISDQAKVVPFYLAPPPSIASTLEARIAATVIEIYRISGVEYAKASGVNTSAQSKEVEFEKTNVAIASLAQALARADRETLILVGRALGIAEEELQAIECTAHESYADASLGDELEQVTQALELDIGTQAKVELLQRLVQKLLPGLSSETKLTIDDEIEKAVVQSQKDKEAATAALVAGVEDNPDDDNPDNPDDNEPPADDPPQQEAA